MFNVRRVSVERLSFSTEWGGLGKGHPVGTAGWTPSPARGRQRALGTQGPGGGGAAQMRRRRRTRGPASARAGLDVSQWRRVSARRGRRKGGRAGGRARRARSRWGGGRAGDVRPRVPSALRGLGRPCSDSRRPVPLPARCRASGGPGAPDAQARSRPRGRGAEQRGRPGDPQGARGLRTPPGSAPDRRVLTSGCGPSAAPLSGAPGSGLAWSDLPMLISAAEGRIQSPRGRGPLALKTNLLFAFTLHTTHPFKAHN